MSQSSDSLTVIKFGGKLLEDEAALEEALLAFRNCPGKKILVHGGGRSATVMAERLGIEAPLINGRRITNADMLRIAVMTYAGWVNKDLVARLQQKGIQALGLTGADLSVIEAHKRPVGEIDYGFAGDIDSVQVDMILPLLEREIVPVFAPITHDGQGQLLNTNADTIASALGQALASQFKIHLVYCFELPGILENPNDPKSLIPQINYSSFKIFQKTGIISGGMIPKLDNAFEAIRKGVYRVYLCQPNAIAHIQDRQFSGTILID